VLDQPAGKPQVIVPVRPVERVWSLATAHLQCAQVGDLSAAEVLAERAHPLRAPGGLSLIVLRSGRIFKAHVGSAFHTMSSGTDSLSHVPQV
jgi:hypothetical protein